MGQQQLLLLVLAAIIVGAGVILGVNMFQENAAQANRDAVLQDVMNFAGKAQAWYRRPAAMGGGGQSFGTFDWADVIPGATGASYTNDNGTYVISGAAGNNVTITGTGKEDMDDNGTNLQVSALVTGVGVTVSYPES
jgi:hypothetical protein